MPVSFPHIDASRLKLVQANCCSPGRFLFKNAGHGPEPLLTFRDPNDGGERTYAVTMVEDQRRRFVASDMARNSGHWLAIDDWRLVVDPATAYMGTNAMPEIGDAFISDGEPGFVAEFNHNTIYVSAAGALLREPNWGDGYVGFRNWSIRIDGSSTATEHTLFERVWVSPDDR